jgi:MoaD family protein
MSDRRASMTNGHHPHAAAAALAAGDPVSVRLRLFASAREAAGTAAADLTGVTVGDVLDEAVARFGPVFGDVLAHSRVWVNGEPAERAQALADGDEVAVLPPVSGGAG